MPQVVFPDCTAYMAQFFDEAALAIVPELELRVARPSPDALLEVVREAGRPLPRGHPLTRLDNVVLSAHAAWMSPEAARRLVCLGLTALREELARLTEA